MAPMTSSPSNRQLMMNLNPNNVDNSNNNNLTSTSSPNHHIPFHSTNHQPSQLGFGFGFGSSFSNPSTSSASPSTSTQWGTSTSTNNSFNQNQFNSFSLPAPLISSTNNQFNHSHPNSNSTSPWKSTTPRKQDSKRRRDQDDDDLDSNNNGGDQDMSIAGRSSSGSPVPSNNNKDTQRYNSQGRQLLPKRMRAGLGTGLDDNSRIINGGGSLSSKTNIGGYKPLIGGNALGGMQSPAGGSGKEKERREESDTTGVDLGKMLASLDKPALLSLLQSLLTTSTDPKLPSQIISLLPAPSLESVDSALDEAERAVRQSLPWGTGSRDEYIWSRVRNNLFEFVNVSLSYAPFFMPKDSSKYPSNNENNSNGKKVEPIHPASTFAFLQSLTVRLLRIESGLPSVPRNVFNFNSSSSKSSNLNSGNKNEIEGSPETFKRILISLLPSESNEGELLLSPSSPDTLISTLAPALLSNWNTLITNLSTQVNQEGRMFGKDVVLGWGRTLVALGMAGAPNGNLNVISHPSSTNKRIDGRLKNEERAIRLAMDGIREKFENQLGWMVATPSYSNVNVHHQGSSMRNVKRERDSDSVTMEEEEL